MFAIAEFLGIRKIVFEYLIWPKDGQSLYNYCSSGVVLGTIMGLQLSLIWPTFMEMGGHVIALPLFMETFMFPS